MRLLQDEGKIRSALLQKSEVLFVISQGWQTPVLLSLTMLLTLLLTMMIVLYEWLVVYKLLHGAIGTYTFILQCNFEENSVLLFSFSLHIGQCNYNHVLFSNYNFTQCYYQSTRCSLDYYLYYLFLYTFCQLSNILLPF